MEKEKIDITGIYHTHTKYSKFNHGKNTVAEMINGAIALGLKEFAITDHGYKHIFGIRKKNVARLRNEIDEENKKSEMQCLMGLELNLLGNNGECDFEPRYDDILDIRLLGVHRAGRVSFKNLFKFLLSNWIHHNNVKRIEKNTDSYISAIKKYKIDIITHPNEYVLINPKRLAEACAKNNCYIEINNKHLKLTTKDIEQMLETDVKFILGSDAHKVETILKVDDALNFINEAKIPLERIVNINGLPDFKNKYGKKADVKPE